MTADAIKIGFSQVPIVALSGLDRSSTSGGGHSESNFKVIGRPSVVLHTQPFTQLGRSGKNNVKNIGASCGCGDDLREGKVCGGV